MKTFLLFFTALFTAPLLFAQQPAPAAALPLITTNGSALIRVVPDAADLTFEVEIRHPDLNEARKQEADRMQKILVALRAAGLVESGLQTSQVEIAPFYGNNEQETAQVKFYRVWQTVSCTVHDMKKVSDITVNIVLAGATGVREMNLRTSEMRVYRDRARAMALRAARDKAAAMATELGVKIGRPFSINEGFEYPTRALINGSNIIQQVADAAPVDSTNQPFAPGTIEVAASVTVSFFLE